MVEQNYLNQTEKMESVKLMLGEMGIGDFELVKDKISYRLVNANFNAEELPDLPYQKVEDLALIYQISLSDNDGKRGTMKVTHEHVKVWGIDYQELMDVAKENTLKMYPPILSSMEDVLKELTGDMEFAENLLTAKGDVSEMNKEAMYVLTNKDKYFGATMMAFSEVMDKITEIFPDGFHILPSSTHEILIVPVEGSVSARELGEMVRDVNENQVEPEEQLSDRVYKYSKEDRSIKQVEESLDRRHEVARSIGM